MVVLLAAWQTGCYSVPAVDQVPPRRSITFRPITLQNAGEAPLAYVCVGPRHVVSAVTTQSLSRFQYPALVISVLMLPPLQATVSGHNK